MNLFDYQIASAKRLSYLLENRGVAADTSDTGIGKTVTALAVAREAGVRFIVVCPRNTITHWTRWIAAMGLADSCLAVSNWEQYKLGLRPDCYSHRDGWLLRPREIIIFDEAHKAKNAKTQNAAIVGRARRQGIWILLLSATLVQSVLSLSGLAYPLGLVAEQRYWSGFAKQYGLALNRWRGWDDFSTKGQRIALHNLLEKVGSRVRRGDISLKSAITEADLIDVPNADAIRLAYESLAARLAELEELKADASELIVARLRGRQEVELLKVPAFVEIAVEHLEAGNKVVMFLCFNDSIAAAAKLLENEKNIRLGVITGSITGSARDKAIADFNDGLGNILLVNIAAGGEGISLHDTTGDAPRIALLSPPESAVQLIQALGRIGGRQGQHSVGLNRILFMAGTIEETVHRHVTAKIERIGELNDGDLAI